jgi:molybdopterin-guanine dinucleotide biosynthesis protein B
LIEGYKSEPYAKLEVFREAVGKAPLYPGDCHIVAIASNPVISGARLPVVHLNDIEALGDAVCACAEPFDSVLARLEERPAKAP